MAHLKKVQISKRSWEEIQPDLLGLGIFEDGKLSNFQKEVDKKCGGCISDRISANDFVGKKGKAVVLYTTGPAKRILLVGMGKREKFDLEILRQTAGTAVKTAQKNKLDSIVTEIPGKKVIGDIRLASQEFVEGLILGSYKFLDYKSDTKDETVLRSVTIINGASRSGVGRGCAIADAVCFTRNLGFHPSNVITPSRLATEARKIARESGMKCTVWGRDQFTKKGMGAFASVAKGTSEPPKFILMEYQGGKKGKAPFAFVGKGITFDSGGISIKPSKSMDEMKFDMSGAGTVLGIMKAIGQLKPNLNIVAAVAATENMPGGRATKPGDIVKAYNGKSIEILNTDAEGRLVLADALAYMSKNFKPRYIVDFATLTGAVIISLGHRASGIMGTDEKLIDALKKAGEITGERVWELPLWDDYCEDVKSKIADVKNMGAERQAGTIAGGAFLKEFVDDIPWAHVDIAGTAWWNKDLPYMPAGPSGVGVRLSLELLNILK